MGVRRFEDLIAWQLAFQLQAEGFGRYRPKEFQYFLRIAAASLHETKNHLLDGLQRGYHSEKDYERRRRLCLRGIKANSHLQRYLETAVPPGWHSKEPKNPKNPENPENLENPENH